MLLLSLVVNTTMACPPSGMKRKMMAVSRHTNQPEREHVSQKQTERGPTGRRAKESSKFVSDLDLREHKRTRLILLTVCDIALSQLSRRSPSGRPLFFPNFLHLSLGGHWDLILWHRPYWERAEKLKRWVYTAVLDQGLRCKEQVSCPRLLDKTRI